MMNKERLVKEKMRDIHDNKELRNACNNDFACLKVSEIFREMKIWPDSKIINRKLIKNLDKEGGVNPFVNMLLILILESKK